MAIKKEIKLTNNWSFFVDNYDFIESYYLVYLKNNKKYENCYINATIDYEYYWDITDNGNSLKEIISILTFDYLKTINSEINDKEFRETFNDICKIFENFDFNSFDLKKECPILKKNVNLKEYGDTFMARSLAKRILNDITFLEWTNTIIFDFNDIDTVGQGFADEIFRVFKNKNPNINLKAINCNEEINFFIKKATNNV